VIPHSATSGQLRWSVIGGDGTSRLIGRSEVISVGKQVSSTYSCPVCCPWSLADLFPIPGSFTGPPGALTSIYVDGIWTECYGNFTPRYPYPYPCNWSSEDPNVISVCPETLITGYRPRPPVCRQGNPRSRRVRRTLSTSMMGWIATPSGFRSTVNVMGGLLTCLRFIQLRLSILTGPPQARFLSVAGSN
jgi:hypothetical protein